MHSERVQEIPGAHRDCRRQKWIAGALGLLLTACAASHGPGSSGFDSTPSLAFVTDGVTSRAEAVARLGEPATSLEGGRILTYALVIGRDAQPHLVTPPVAADAPWMRSWRRFALVLVFAENGSLERHALVPLE